MTRRQSLKSAGIGAATVALHGIDPVGAQDSSVVSASVKALVFDVFGTVVDWRGSIVKEGGHGARARASPSIGLALRIGGAPDTGLRWRR
jgi:hypothetical protein